MTDVAVVVLSALSAVSSVVALLALRAALRPCPCEQLRSEINAVRLTAAKARGALETMDGRARSGVDAVP